MTQRKYWQGKMSEDDKEAIVAALETSRTLGDEEAALAFGLQEPFLSQETSLKMAEKLRQLWVEKHKEHAVGWSHDRGADAYMQKIIVHLPGFEPLPSLVTAE